MPKTLGIKLDDELHARLTVLAQVEGVSLTELIRQAIERFAAEKRDEPALRAKAEEILAEMDRETAARRDAIESLLTGEKAASPKRGNKKGQ